HVAIFVLGLSQLLLSGLRQNTGHQGFNFGPVPNRMQPIVAGDLAKNAGVALAVWSAAGLPVLALKGRIRIMAESAAGAMRPRIGSAAALAAALVAGLALRPYPRLDFSLLAIRRSPVIPQ